LELFEREFRAFHDFVEGMLKHIKVQPVDIQPGLSFQPLGGLAKYKNGALLSTMIIGKEANRFECEFIIFLKRFVKKYLIEIARG